MNDITNSGEPINLDISFPLFDVPTIVQECGENKAKVRKKYENKFSFLWPEIPRQNPRYYKEQVRVYYIPQYVNRQYLQKDIINPLTTHVFLHLEFIPIALHHSPGHY